jgi:hypothetical protein
MHSRNALYYYRCRACANGRQYTSCSSVALRRWRWNSAPAKCGAFRINTTEAQALLIDRWIACVGDSIARNLCTAILRAVGSKDADAAIERHADFDRSFAGNDGRHAHGKDVAPSGNISFHWRPFPSNATELIAGWKHQRKPALAVVSVGLWHMLHVRDPGRYKDDVAALTQSTVETLPKLPGRPRPLMVMANNVEVHHDMLIAPEKRTAMTPDAVDAYNKGLNGAGALAPHGPYGLLDLFSLTHGECRLYVVVVVLL